VSADPPIIATRHVTRLSCFEPTTVAEVVKLLKTIYASQVVRSGSSSDLAAQASRICHRTDHLPSVQSVHEEWRVSGIGPSSSKPAYGVQPLLKKYTLDPDDVSSYRPISPTFQSSSNVLSLAAYLITRPLSTSCQPNSQLTGLSTPHKPPHTVRPQRPRLCYRQWQSVTACTIRSQRGFRHRRSPDTAVGIRKPIFHRLHRCPLV